MDKNPFKLTPITTTEEMIGYKEERKALESALNRKGITLLLSDEGYGKSSLLRVLCYEKKGIYVQRCTYTQLVDALRPHVPLTHIVYRIFGDPTDVITKPVLVDECAAMTLELASTFNNLYDRDVKVVLSMTHDECRGLKSMPYGYKTLFDRVTSEVILSGFSPDEVKEYIKHFGQDKFEDAVIEEISARYSKPRDVAQICYDLWDTMIKEKKNKITLDMLPERKTKLKEAIKYELIGGNKMQKIYEYIQSNPGSVRGDIASELKMNPNSVGNLLAILMRRKLIRKDKRHKYYIYP